jgi:hypothetical protein
MIGCAVGALGLVLPIPVSAATKKVPKACTIVTADDVKTLTRGSASPGTGADNPKGSVCSYIGDNALVALSYFSNLSENEFKGAVIVLGKTTTVKGVPGVSVWLNSRSDSALVRKGSAALQISVVGTPMSTGALKTFAASVAKRM